MTSEAIWYAWDKQRDYVVSGDGQGQLGAMSTARWTEAVDQLVKLDVLKKSIPAADLFDASYLPKVGAPTTMPAAPSGSY